MEAMNPSPHLLSWDKLPDLSGCGSVSLSIKWDLTLPLKMLVKSGLGVLTHNPSYSDGG